MIFVHHHRQSAFWGSLAVYLLVLNFTKAQTTSSITHTPMTLSNTTLDSIRVKYHLPGLAAARIKIQHHDEIRINSRATGVRKFGNDTKLTPRDKFHLGSLTKAMTATLVAILIETPHNSLRWNTTVPEALPHIANIIPAYRNTTLAMLASHYAGFDDETFLKQELPLWMKISNRTYTPVKGRRLLAERAFSYEPATRPGSAYAYSNLGYMLIGHIIDTHSPPGCGSWEEFLFRYLFGPLRMDGCGLGPVPQRTPHSISNPWPHLPGHPEPIPVPLDTDNPPTLGPAGTVHCTIDSYAKFLALHVEGSLGNQTPLLPASAFTVLHTPYRTLAGLPPSGDKGPTDWYTPGAWALRNNPSVGGGYLSHDGSNRMNYAVGIVAPGVREAYFVGTNVGEADAAANEVAIGLLTHTLGFNLG
ncbi:beta-lactamase [Podospora didyma]|uniref:Beta-lactamase n=1 Tax=Podospora didyma TaxID=330526 RepID=A0AAE0NXE0_9PEZI|nr:beta-lactamase [Podospora didyma]